MHLHHLLEVLSFYCAKVTKIIKVTNSIKSFLIFMDPCIVVWISRNSKEDATSQQNLLFQCLLRAQHFLSGIPLIIRSSKLYLQLLVYIHMWWRAVVKSEWELRLDNSRSPHVYVNQRLQIQFRAPDDEQYPARNMLSPQ